MKPGKTEKDDTSAMPNLSLSGGFWTYLLLVLLSIVAAYLFWKLITYGWLPGAV